MSAYEPQRHSILRSCRKQRQTVSDPAYPAGGSEKKPCFPHEADALRFLNGESCPIFETLSGFAGLLENHHDPGIPPGRFKEPLAPQCDPCSTYYYDTIPERHVDPWARFTAFREPVRRRNAYLHDGHLPIDDDPDTRYRVGTFSESCDDNRARHREPPEVP